MVKQDGEWFGYSYEWNDEQTEGVLVENAGKERNFEIRDTQAAGGVRQQTWHYPSRTECMVCHSRAANWVLGLTAMQMNKIHQYGTVADESVADNQLRVLEHLGLLKVNWFQEARDNILEEALARGLTDKEAALYVDKLCATRGQRGPVGSSLLTRAADKYRALVGNKTGKGEGENTFETVPVTKPSIGFAT